MMVLRFRIKSMKMFLKMMKITTLFLATIQLH